MPSAHIDRVVDETEDAPAIFTPLIGQEQAVAALARAIRDAADPAGPGPAMTHAWLFTGPPGSGRSTAAGCFAAALLCSAGGCGSCATCTQVPSGAHPDVEIVRPEGLSYSVDEARALIQRAALAPSLGMWHVFVIEDADRMTEQAVNVLLKILEEPPERTVWLLCAPSLEDVLPTVRSRVRHVSLRTPQTSQIAQALVSRYGHEGVEIPLATFAARASGGHVGRARALALDERVRIRRQEILRIPLELRDLPSCFVNAANLLDAATEDAAAITQPLDAAELASLHTSFGSSGGAGLAAVKGQLKRSMEAAEKELQRRQKVRGTRTVRDQVDRALVDMMGMYRDVLFLQVGAELPLINDEMRPQLHRLAASSTPVETLRRLDAITRTRAQIQSAVTPLLAFESLMVQLKDPTISGSGT